MKFQKRENIKKDIGRVENMEYNEKVTLIFVKIIKHYHLHRFGVLNLKPNMSVIKIFINVRNAQVVLTRKNASKETIVKLQWKNEIKSFL